MRTYRYGALAALLTMAVWSVTALWTNMVTPSGALTQEIIFLSTVAVMFWVLVPLYGKAVQWSYVAGIFIIALSVFGGSAVAALHRELHFSVSFYNILTGLLYVIAVVGIYFSYQCYKKLPRIKRKKAICGVGGIILVMIVVGGALFSSANTIERYMFMSTLHNTDKTLGTMETIDEKIQYLMERGDIPSLAACIVVDDTVVWANAYGEQSSLDTIYNIGSITKPFVATAVLQLYEQGLLDLDDDVNTYLPFSMRHPEYPDTPITIRMLLTHQSGLAHYTNQYHQFTQSDELLDWLSEYRGWDVTKYDPQPSFAAFMEGYITPDGLYYTPYAWSPLKPGTGYSYSTPGYDTLGYIVERVTNQPFSEYLRENIFEPLNMTSTGFKFSDLPERQAKPYERIFGVLTKTNVDVPLSDRERIGGGGIRSTAPDLAQFMIAHMNQGEINGYRLLNPETVALMHSRVIETSVDIFMAGSGYGWTLRDTEPWTFWGRAIDMQGAQGHGGTDYGYRCSMWFVKTDKGAYGFVLMTNLSTLAKSDFRWFLTIYTTIEELLLQEASMME